MGIVETKPRGRIASLGGTRRRGGATVRWLTRIAVAGLFASAGTASAEREPFAWGTVNAENGYSVEGAGDPRSDAGARVVVRANARSAGQFGGAIGGIDAAPLRGSRIVIEADLAPSADGAGASVVASIWLRVDDAQNKPLEFATSGNDPVPAASTGRRTLALRVPTAAQRVVLGVGLRGQGSVVATRYRLLVDADAKIPRDVTARRVMDAAVDIVKRNALKAGAIDWAAADATYRDDVARAKMPADVYPAIRRLLASLRDGHSFFVRPDDAKQYEARGRETSPAVVKLLPGGIGYVRMPGFVGTAAADQTAFAQRVTDEIDAIQAQATRGWIVDLRRNGGGNLWPMLAGLRALLGDGEVGAFRRGDGAMTRWRAGDNVDGLAAIKTDLRDARVAVVLGARTASSGEAVAVAFHGRPHTRSFGQPTAGQANSNTTYTLPDDSRINLATAVDVDRHGVAFGQKVEPDVAVDGDEEQATDAAIAWLTDDRP